MAKGNKEVEEKVEKFVCGNHKNYHCGGHGDAIYGLSVIGALFYFLQNTGSLQEILLGIGKAIFWPAILMFKLLTYLRV